MAFRENCRQTSRGGTISNFEFLPRKLISDSPKDSQSRSNVRRFDKKPCRFLKDYCLRIVETRGLHAGEIPSSYIRVAGISLGRYTPEFEEYAVDIVFLRCTGQVPPRLVGYACGVCILGVFPRNKSINFFIVLVLHRGQNSNAAGRGKRAGEWRTEGVRSLKLYGASIKVGKKSGGEASWKVTSDVHVLRPFLALFLKCNAREDTPPKTFSRVVGRPDTRALISHRSGGSAPTLEYDVLANLTLDLYCRSLISVTQLLPGGAAPAPIKKNPSRSLNEDEVYIFSYNHDEYLF